MDISKVTGAPAGTPAPDSLPAGLVTWLAQFPPEFRGPLEAAGRQAIARGELGKAPADYVRVLAADPALGARVIMAVVEGFLKGLERPLESLVGLVSPSLKEMFQRELDKALLEQMKALAELAKEQARAAEMMRLFLEEEAIRGQLRQLKQQDVQVALESMRRQGGEQRKQEWKLDNLSAIVATGLVGAIAAPVQAHSQLEGASEAKSVPRASLADARSDERLTSLDHLEAMRRMAGDLPR